MPSEQRKYGNFENYYAQINGGSGTMGVGTDLQAQAAAIIASRNKNKI